MLHLTRLSGMVPVLHHYITYYVEKPCILGIDFLKLQKDIKGTVSRDFLLLVLFMDQFPPSPRSIPLRPF
jgi:hypothetical protein